jgi:hypothetical protein
LIELGKTKSCCFAHVIEADDGGDLQKVARSHQSRWVGGEETRLRSVGSLDAWNEIEGGESAWDFELRPPTLQINNSLKGNISQLVDQVLSGRPGDAELSSDSLSLTSWVWLEGPGKKCGSTLGDGSLEQLDRARS